MSDKIHVQHIFRQLLHFSRQLEGKGYCAYISETSDGKIQNDSKLTPTHPCTRETHESFCCIEIKSVLVYKHYNALLKKYDFESYIKTDTRGTHI